MNYSGANSLFLRVLLCKKYALPYQIASSSLSSSNIEMGSFFQKGNEMEVIKMLQEGQVVLKLR